MSMDKRRKTEVPPKKRESRIFRPFRALGNVTNEIPFAIGTLGGSFYLVTSVGRGFQIFDATNLHLLFISQKQTPSKITTLAAHFHYVYAGYGNKIGVYKRGRLEHEISLELASPSATVSRILVFGEYTVATSTDGYVTVFKKPADSKIATEYYTAIKSIHPQFDGDIVGLLHPPTYLNKIVVATTNNIYLINVRTAKIIFKSPDNFFGEAISCIEHAPALDVIAVGTATGGVFLYNLRTATLIGERIIVSPKDVAARVVSLSFRTDGSQHLVAALNTGDLYFYDLEQRTKVHYSRACHAEAYGGVANAKFLNGQPIVVSNGGDNVLKEIVFDPPLSSSNKAVVGPPRHLRSRGGHAAPPVAITFPDEDKSHFIYSASKDQSFWCFSLRKDAQAQEMSQRLPKKATKEKFTTTKLIHDKFPEVTSFAMSLVREGDWENMVTTHKNETFARTWDSKSKRVGRHLLNTVDGGLAKVAAVSHCGNFAFVGSSEGGIGVYNLQSGLLRRKYMLHKKTVSGVAVDGMNRKMVSSGLDGIVGFYNFADLKYLGKLELGEPITELIYHKGSDLIACALDDLTIVVIDVVTQKVVRILYGHTNRITGMDFSPDGRWIVSVGLDGTLRTWDLPTGGCIDGIRLPSVATRIKFSPLGDFIATTHVSGNGIFLWTNRAQFYPVSTRHVEDSEFSDSLLPNVTGDGGASMIEGALDSEADRDIDTGHYRSLDQINADLITLSVGSRTKYNTILHVDTIKQRNKPKEAPKKPEQAPFFLSLSGQAVGDRAVVAENGAAETVRSTVEGENGSRLLNLNGNKHAFESEFTRKLREAAASGNYDAFIAYLCGCSPAILDLEIRSMNAIPPLLEMIHFVAALGYGLKSNTNYDLIQAIYGLFLKTHGDVIYSNRDADFAKALTELDELNKQKENKLDNLVKFCSGIIDFVSVI